MKDVPAIFGSMVFNDRVMRERLPKDVYRAMKRTMSTARHLELDVANVVAATMKEWAVEKGATHFTHWFQPMTGITAEKHDSFITSDGTGAAVMEFSGKELVKGEPDASSFPSGGLRATFEARGYTAWDPTSYAFVKDDTLYIPTAFCSYNGEALDKKTPLLRSMDAIDGQAKRILKLFGKEVTRIDTTVGPEQEYFLVDKKVFLRRPDLIHCGRTLFGAKAVKGQELEDHYFGSLKPRVSAFMKDLDEELWKLGILAKTKHNEVAPAQHELAPIFTQTNIAADHNQLVMEMMKSVADKHGMACLLHEKPFAGINGSGKHNNWSISADGANLLEPGDTPQDNAQFLLFLSAVIKAVDEYQDLLRVSVASAGNDHRLGANEAPPAIVSIYLGAELTEILESIADGLPFTGKEKQLMGIGVSALPHFPKDSTDRNRTSPFAFTGNKFEFRMLGSAFSISGPNIVLNTIVAEELEQFADVLEKSKDMKADMHTLVAKTIREHRRIIFNGDGYSKEWQEEAVKRGLLNLKTTPEALPKFAEEKNVNLFVKHGVFTATEVHSRCEIMLEHYCKVIIIEGRTMLDMIKRCVIPGSLSWQREVAETVGVKKSVGVESSSEKALLVHLSGLTDEIDASIASLEAALAGASSVSGVEEKALYCRHKIVSAMEALRAPVDSLETIVPDTHWKVPTYGEILYSVN